MPIYEFICKSCGEEFDKLTSSDWQAVGVSCAQCHSTDLERMISRTGGFTTGCRVEAASLESYCQSCSNDGNGSCRF